MKILIFERDESCARGLRYYLQQTGHQVLLAIEAVELADMIRQETPDLLITGQEMIEVAGMRLFDESHLSSKLPFILPVQRLTAPPASTKGKEDEPNAVYGDIYRQQAETITDSLRLLRRGHITRLRVGSLTINFDRKHALFCGESLHLTPLQFKLLSALALHAKRVVAYRDLLQQVWGFEGDDQEARELLKVHINRIRQKMKMAAPEAPPHIHVVRGFGYMLAGPGKERRGNQ